MKQNFQVIQKAEIKKGKKFLVMKRAPTARAYPNRWDFPGGKMEHGENPYKAIEREIKEETNFKAKALRPEFVFSEKFSDHYNVFIFYKCKQISGKIKISEEHTEHKWASKKEIMKMKLETSLREYLKIRRGN
ncbi:MAG: NUDIX hydrolase [Candidatus ainarchaeum sp.]|nr:NUDIX hydrolase [Candidatus ainarchaeum sp.]